MFLMFSCTHMTSHVYWTCATYYVHFVRDLQPNDVIIYNIFGSSTIILFPFTQNPKFTIIIDSVFTCLRSLRVLPFLISSAFYNPSVTSTIVAR